MLKKLKFLLIPLIMTMANTGCSTDHLATQSKRAAIEQLLLSEAFVRSLPEKIDSFLPIPPGANVKLEVSGISGDEKIAQAILAGWLSQQGYLLQDEASKASYKIHMILESLGTEFGKVLVGLPEDAIGELALYKAERQTGYANWFLDVFELPSGRHITRTSPFFAETFYNDYTTFLIFKFHSTNLRHRPRLGSFESH